MHAFPFASRLVAACVLKGTRSDIIHSLIIKVTLVIWSVVHRRSGALAIVIAHPGLSNILVVYLGAPKVDKMMGLQ